MAGNHWHNTKGKLYRSRQGKLLGVCQGLADYLGINVTLVRACVVVLTLFSMFWPMLIIYVLAGVLLDKEPVICPENVSEERFYSTLSQSRSTALREIKERLESLHKKISRMEDKVTKEDVSWEERLRR